MQCAFGFFCYFSYIRSTENITSFAEGLKTHNYEQIEKSTDTPDLADKEVQQRLFESWLNPLTSTANQLDGMKDCASMALFLSGLITASISLSIPTK
ncbi:Unannotated [Lentimonas sp. CC4]|nr:Unannotated [Lentimonas sp. CC4]CAA6684372.1 Unannotated [Lentimonas sp. CC6]CAA7078108.1 Unannotated [Lentimonas sp. CC4]CAA7172076.1 Unannotated [Lentimonas sp. CC21]CAA7183132.1 Unannotated [Lentimonas sp. CC8]